MKTRHFVATIAAILPLAVMPTVKADELSAMATLACEATLCLSVAQPPTECTPSLSKYFSIVFRQPWKTIAARRNFLKLCPDVTDANASQQAEQSVSRNVAGDLAPQDTGSAAAPQLVDGDQPEQASYQKIQATLNALKPAWEAQVQLSIAARTTLQRCIAQQGPLETGYCQAERTDYDAKRHPAIALRDEISRLESQLASAGR